MCRAMKIMLCLGLLVNGFSPVLHSSQAWIEEPCPPRALFSFCVVTERPGTWIWLDQGWTALGILVNPWLIEICNPYTGQIINQIHAPRTGVFKGLPAFSPDGQLLATPVDDGTIRVWEVQSGRELWTLPSRKEGGSAAFGPDGKLYSLGLDGEIVVWDVKTGTKFLSLREFEPCGGAAVIGLSPDGRWLVGLIPWWVDTVGAVDCRFWASVVWDMTTGQVARVFPGWVYFLPDDQLLVLEPCSPLPKAMVWDGPLGSKPWAMRLPWVQAILGLSVRSDGQYIAFGLADGTIRFLNVSTAQEVAQLALKTVLGPGAEAHWISFSPDGNFLLTVWAPEMGKLQVYLWHVGELLKRAGP